MAANDQPPTWKVAGVVGFYMTVALIMVMTNKWVLSTSSLPLTFLLLQLATSVLLLHLLPLFYNYTPPRWTKSTILAVVPVSVVNVIGLIFNIYCLKLVDASYFQVARGLTLPMTVILQSLNNGIKPNGFTIISCGIVMWGFTYSFLPIPFTTTTIKSSSMNEIDIYGIEIQQEKIQLEAPMAGMLLGIASAAMVAIHAILVKQALKKVEGHTLDLAYWQNALSCLVLIPGIIFSSEIKDFAKMIIGEQGDGRAFIIGCGVTGVVGFLICLAGLLSIKVTSPVTHMFSSAMRSVLQTMLGVYIFGDILNSSRIMSIVLIIIGSCLYTWNQSRSHSPKSPLQEDRKRLLTGQEKLNTYANDPEKGERKD
ncbi:uncharacterized protein I206_106567 [Kwoniella pini CBS 10737]|uniref:GDP-mannose transporter n=1 Tax=Kwoniella pini CBS 10737 TaxID=1296096 RepID=A0A1B9HTU4_9TREE|nr:uncharacterized protein I206_07542 [Kwoniella pini CBS 10737]OCF46687.1 hypothetical protein I206_07542 [Kwoniella pini CBS 10737]